MKRSGRSTEVIDCGLDEAQPSRGMALGELVAHPGRISISWTLSALLVLACLSLSAESPGGLAGSWGGAIEIPGMPLGVQVVLSHEDGGWSGTIDIPMQGAEGLALEKVSVEGVSVSFAIAGIPGSPTFAGELKDGEIRGSFSQGGQSFPFHLGRGTQATQPPRPQEPKPPYPYDAEEVTYRNGEIDLAGTLTLPRSPGPHPALLLITGSGSQNRDEEIFGHKPFLVIADHLTRRGFAVLRVDDRGVGGSGVGPKGATTADLATDVEAGLAFLAGQPRIDRHKIGLLGHSEGGLIAPMVAARNRRVAFLVLLAAPAVRGDELLLRQNELLLRSAWAGDDAVQKQLGFLRQMFALLESEAPRAEVKAGVEALVREQIALETGSEDVPDEQVATQTESVLNPWFRFFLTHDPAPDLRAVKVPVLALNGELDLQVDPKQNLGLLASLLREGGQRDVTTKILPKLNHLFQTATTGQIAEYAQIEETLAPEVLETIASFLEERFLDKTGPE